MAKKSANKQLFYLLSLIFLALGLGWALYLIVWPRGPIAPQTAKNGDKAETLPQLLPPLPQTPLVQVYFNHSGATAYQEPYRPIKRLGDNLESVMIEAIASAQSTIDVAVQELRLPLIAKSLVAKQQSGVKVRVIIEHIYKNSLSNLTPEQLAKLDQTQRQRYQEFLLLTDTNKDGQISADERQENDAIAMLQNANIPIIDDTADGSKGSGLMHHKFIVIDQQTVIVTSANFTPSDIHGDLANQESRGNPNNLLKLNSPQLAQIFQDEFEQIWGDGPGLEFDSKFGSDKINRPPQTVILGDVKVTVKFSPDREKKNQQDQWLTSTNGLIGKTLSRANQSIDLALFVFSEHRLAEILERQSQRQIAIRGLIESDFAYRYYSSGLAMMGVVLLDDQVCQGVRNWQKSTQQQPWQKPLTTVGIANLPKGDRLHHKFGIIDNQIVITGSHNWTEGGNNKNDETLLIIDSPIIGAHYQREFSRLYDRAILGIPSWLQTKMQKQQKECQLVEAKTSPSLREKNRELGGGNRASPLLKKININQATQTELETLPGIGPKVASKIIEVRQQKPFRSLADLDQVPGIGPKIIEKIADRITW